MWRDRAAASNVANVKHAERKSGHEIKGLPRALGKTQPRRSLGRGRRILNLGRKKRRATEQPGLNTVVCEQVKSRIQYRVRPSQDEAEADERNPDGTRHHQRQGRIPVAGEVE